MILFGGLKFRFLSLLCLPTGNSYKPSVRNGSWVYAQLRGATRELGRKYSLREFKRERPEVVGN